MRIKFNDGTEKRCYNPRETMIFQSGKPAAWLFSFGMDVSDAKEAEKMLTENNITKISIENNDGTQIAVGGYESIHSIVVAYSDEGGIASVDLKRGIENE